MTTVVNSYDNIVVCNTTDNIVVVGSNLGTQGPAGELPTGASALLDVVATSNLENYKAVTANQVYADVTGDYKAIGFTTESVQIGQSTKFQLLGPYENPSWNLTVGGLVYLSTTGGITQVLPTSGRSVILGVAVSATTIVINISPISINIAE